jgi:lipopolysaccharide export system ATP-binding protein
MKIEVNDLYKSYRGKNVVNGVSFHLDSGEVAGILGPNGAGKTTTFCMAVGLVRPDKGAILLEGVDITRMPMHGRARRGLGYLPQETSVFRGLTVRENLMAVLEIMGGSKKKQLSRLHELMDDLRISALGPQKAYTLSGGEKRRLEIARALAASPSFLLLDEPFTGIDPIAVQDIQEIIFGLKQKGYGVLITDHNVRETLAITDRAYIMYEGKIIIRGSSAELEKDPQARKVYLGEKFKLG